MSETPAAPAPTPLPSSPTPAATPAEAQRRLASLSMVWDHARQYPWQIAAAITGLIGSSSATLAIPAGFKLVIDRGFATGNTDNINRYFLYLLGIVLVLAVATTVRFFFVSWLGERTVADIRRAVQRNLLRQPPAFFEENRPSEISSRMTSDTAVIEMVVGTTISVALRNCFTGLGGLAYLFYLSPTMAGFIIVGIPLVIMPIVVVGRRLQKLSRASQDSVASVGSMTTEVLGAMKIVQGFGQERREEQRFADAVEHTFATARRRITIRSIMTASVIGLIFGGIVCLLWYGAWQVVEGQISVGTLAAFVLTGGFVAGAFGALTEVYGDLVRGAGAASRLAELLHAEPAIKAPAKPRTLPAVSTGSLAFTAVEFRYPTRPDTAALHDFTLEVEANETVAVVGPSGAGKSTLFQLAQRFYDPQAGRITMDGIGIRDVDPADVRARMAVVPQETVVFAASARDNLRYGNWEASDAEIWEAADAANASEFLKKLPDGLDTFMGEAGTRLSGGQRQRIAIARALLRRAPILLLDEATSALDAESERLVQDALDRLMHQRTTIVIAHRLATVRAADRIIVMDDGRIVEQGNHDSLVEQGGLYARLARLQFDTSAN
ncbi:MAG: ABC transporter transmembrane domain-containing protein [Sphingopyxis sp.]